VTVTLILAAAVFSPILLGLWFTRGDRVSHTTDIQQQYCKAIETQLLRRGIWISQLARELECSENHLKAMLQCRIDMPLHWVEAIGKALDMDFRIVCVRGPTTPTTTQVTVKPH
jgi:hypothetical protein